MKNYLVSYVVSFNNSPVQINSKIINCSERLDKDTIKDAKEKIAKELEQNEEYKQIANFWSSFSITILSLTPLARV